MDWIIQSKDGSISEIKYYTAEDGFLAPLRDLFGDPKRVSLRRGPPGREGLASDSARRVARR